MTTKRFRDIGFKLQIAWSAGWGIVAVLLIVSWVRSYWWDENLKVLISNGHAINVETCSGTVSFNWCRSAFATSMWPTGVTSEPIVDEIRLASFEFSRFTADPRLTVDYVRVPHWFLLTIVAGATIAPWLPYKPFSRTLLIATTLVAVGLGLVVWLR